MYFHILRWPLFGLLHTSATNKGGNTCTYIWTTDKLVRPVGETTWNDNCRSATPESLQRALFYIQTIMAVSGYHDHVNVKNRHFFAYAKIMQEFAKLELVYEYQYATRISVLWQDRWYEFMQAHFMRVVVFTRIWVRES